MEAAAGELRGFLSRPDAAVAAETIGIYIRNLGREPENVKFKKIVCSNKAFQSRVAAVPPALRFLTACGFHEVDGCLVCERPNVKLLHVADEIIGALVAELKAPPVSKQPRPDASAAAARPPPPESLPSDFVQALSALSETEAEEAMRLPAAVLENILRHPGDESFEKIRVNAPRMQHTLERYSMLAALFADLGFVPRGEFLVRLGTISVEFVCFLTCIVFVHRRCPSATMTG
jgi:hypothetical protein